MTDFPGESAIRHSYLEQARFSQLHRWLAVLHESRAEPGDLQAHNLCYELNGAAASGASAKAVLRTVDFSSATAISQPQEISLHVLAASSGESLAQLNTHWHTATADPLLPTLEQVSVHAEAQPAEITARASAGAVPHRILALKHRWHALVESPEKTPEAFKQIIAPEFSMDWQTGGVQGYAELAEWLAGSASSVAAARHDIAAFEWSLLSEGTYQAIFEFDWHGYSHESEPLAAQSRHTWLIEDDPGERYAKLNEMQVEFLTPFHRLRGNHA